jgi:zinc transporter, ZIP family
MQQDSNNKPSKGFSGKDWFLFLVPFVLVGATLVYLTLTKENPTVVEEAPALNADAGEVEASEFTIDNITLPAAGAIQVEVTNGSAETLTIAQVQVDDAYWDYSVVPSNTISATGVATFTIPYPWVVNDVHVVRLLTSRGATYDGEIAPLTESGEAEVTTSASEE